MQIKNKQIELMKFDIHREGYGIRVPKEIKNKKTPTQKEFLNSLYYNQATDKGIKVLFINSYAMYSLIL